MVTRFSDYDGRHEQSQQAADAIGSAAVPKTVSAYDFSRCQMHQAHSVLYATWLCTLSCSTLMPCQHIPRLCHCSLLVQDAVVGALMQADVHSLEKLTWLQDLPERIQHHRQQQQRQQMSEGGEAVAEGGSPAGGMPGGAQVTTNQGLPVRDGNVYQKIEGNNFSWEEWIPLSST